MSWNTCHIPPPLPITHPTITRVQVFHARGALPHITFYDLADGMVVFPAKEELADLGAADSLTEPHDRITKPMFHPSLA